MGKKNATSISKRRKDARDASTSTLKQDRGQDDSAAEFVVERHGPLMLFHFTVPEAQHQALARMESFYESRSDTRTYITLQDPRTKLLCRNYQAFNLPTSAVLEWLQAMQTTEKALNQSQGSTHASNSHQSWWSPFTNFQESQLLSHLWQIDCLNTLTAGEAPSYLISVTDKSAIQHEVSHALFFLHPAYRDKAHKLWMGLSKKCRLVISHDFVMRGYGDHVWVDEFQAYVSENDEEFGNKVRQECKEAGSQLRAAQSSAWKEMGLDAGAFGRKGTPHLNR